MTLSKLPLSYCTNVHPGRTISEVDLGLGKYTANVRRNLDTDLAAGLWLARSVVTQMLATDGAIARFADRLSERNLSCHTLNAFPFGDFHSERVKEQVYVPDWTTSERLDYSIDCASVLAKLIPSDRDGSISTLPLGTTLLPHNAGFHDDCARRLIDCAVRLKRLQETSGRTIRLAIEPEPLCDLQHTDESIQFFQRLRALASDADQLGTVNEFIGVCFDVCHQSIEFEDVAASIASLNDAQIRINKIHITCAIELTDPADNFEARTALAQYVEPRYLHQTFAKMPSGEISTRVDLTTEDVLRSPADDFMQADVWRVHFHVPVNVESLGPLSTTRPDLIRALAAVKTLLYAPHLEVETYTWEVLPGGSANSLVDGLTAEVTATQQLLAEL